MKTGASLIICLGTVFQTTKAIYDDYETSHTRQWTSWYNTDTPKYGGGDDESINSIRKRGFEVCDGNEPLDAICRIATDPATVFNERTTTFTKDALFLPCSAQGVICRDADQRAYRRNCSDYSIRFECLVVNKPDRSENLGIIAVAAGLSVIVPILCVLVMHVMRLVKERRNHGQSRRGSTSSADSREAINQDQGIQTELGDAPPTYDQLFGSNFGSTDTLLGSSFPPSTSVVNNVESSNAEPSTSQTDSAERSSSPNGSLYSISDGQLDTISLNSVHLENETLPPQRGFRLPGMHISIFDLMTSQDDGQTSQVSPNSLDYIQTPPPTYKDALALFGISCGEKGDTEKS